MLDNAKAIAALFTDYLYVVEIFDNDGEPTIHVALPDGREFTLVVNELNTEDIA